MKNKITCLLAAAALFGATANAEIVLGDSLSAYGYLDMALTDLPAGGDTVGNETTTSVVEFELGLSFAPAESAWSAVTELSFDGVSDVAFETATITYAASDALSYTVGNILSYQGFETFDATGLYQYSYASSTDLGNGLGTGPAMYSAGYAVGACVDYSSGAFDFGFWLGDSDVSEMSYEYLVAYNGIENLTVKFIYADDPYYTTTNVWASYDLGDFTFAVETVVTDDEVLDAEVLDLNTFMVYYAMGDAGITFRVTDGEYGAQDFDKFTISPSYAFSDNVFGLVEFSTEELGGNELDTAAVELIYSF
jgi:hypothetical protein